GPHLYLHSFPTRRSSDLFLYSVPTFWLGLILLLVFGAWLRWFPVGGMSDPILCPSVSSVYCTLDRLWHLVLPALTLGLVGAAGTDRKSTRLNSSHDQISY